MEEVRYFGRMSVYALVVGVVYWFLSYEPAGTALLVGFGLATGAGFLVLRPRSRRKVEPDDEGGDQRAPDGPFGDESGPVPTRSAAPLAVGVGVAAIGMSAAFGPWFLLAGAIPLLLGAADWLRAANRESELRARGDGEAPAGTGAPTADSDVPESA
jgi:hypothetical protein